MSTKKHTITLIPGDGIGPEVISATRRIIEAAGADIEWELCEAGAEVFKKGLSSGVPTETIDSIIRNKVALKGPLATPIGYGEKSANVTLRKLFETYGNIRPVRQFVGVPSQYASRNIDVVIVRENVEDLYAGIEYMQTPGVAQCLKIISRKGCEKIIRLAFEFARSEGRKKVTCATKANIMKFTEGFMKKTFEDIAPEYPDIEAEHVIIDNCAHQLVRRPEQFDVIVTTNMNGDIISDLGSALIGGLGFAPGANIGNDVSIFEAVHGSAPKYAGKNVINPTAVLMSGIMMLRHIGEFDIADKVEHAVCVTFEKGNHPLRDMVGNEGSVTTTAFTDAVIENLGQTSATWNPKPFKPIKLPQVSSRPDFVQSKEEKLLGVDVFIESSLSSKELGDSLSTLCEATGFKLKMVSNRGVMVYPSLGIIPDVVDHNRCRFILKDESYSLKDEDIFALLNRIAGQHKWMHIEKLKIIDGVPGFTKAQGED
jgi:isocitrate dehydrogenase